LSLLLKGSKNKSVLKYGLDQSPVYGNFRTLTDILTNWRNRRREEQHQLLESMALTGRGSARRVLQAWHGLAGKEMRSKIETVLSTLA
jgi:hypothetical protein